MISILFIFISFVFDNLIGHIYPVDYAASNYIFTPAFMIIALLLSARKESLVNALLLGFFTGFIYGFLNSNQILFYPLLFLFLCFLSWIWSYRKSDNTLETIILIVVLLFFKELITYLYMVVTKSTVMSLGVWMQMHLFFTIIINLIPIIFLTLISKKLQTYSTQRKEQTRSVRSFRLK